MTKVMERKDTVVPTAEDTKLATESSRVLASAAAAENNLRVKLDNGQQLVLPQAAMKLLSHILSEMSLGNAVTLMPVHAELTTQEAAEQLGVSRPYLISLLNSGKLAFHKTGSHRRIKFEDVCSYKTKREEESLRAREALAAQAEDLDMGY